MYTSVYTYIYIGHRHTLSLVLSLFLYLSRTHTNTHTHTRTYTRTYTNTANEEMSALDACMQHLMDGLGDLFDRRSILPDGVQCVLVFRCSIG